MKMQLGWCGCWWLWWWKQWLWWRWWWWCGRHRPRTAVRKKKKKRCLGGGALRPSIKSPPHNFDSSIKFRKWVELGVTQVTWAWRKSGADHWWCEIDEPGWGGVEGCGSNADKVVKIWNKIIILFSIQSRCRITLYANMARDRTPTSVFCSVTKTMMKTTLATSCNNNNNNNSAC